MITDASKIGLGAVLEQYHDTGWRPVAFWSRKLHDAETRYSTTEREWLVVVEAVSRRWKGFLGRPTVHPALGSRGPEGEAVQKLPRSTLERPAVSMGGSAHAFPFPL